MVIKAKNQKIKWFVTYTVLILICVLSSVFVISAAMESLGSQLLETLNHATKNIMVFCNSELEYQRAYTYTILNNVNVEKIYKNGGLSDEIESSDAIKEIIKQMRIQWAYTETSSDYMLVFEDYDLVITPNGTYNKQEIFDYKFSQCYDSKEQWLDDFLSIKNLYEYKTMCKDSKDKRVAFVHRINNNMNNNSPVIAISIVNEAKLLNPDFQDNKLYIYNKNGEKLFATDNDVDNIEIKNGKKVKINGIRYIMSVVEKSPMKYVQLFENNTYSQRLTYLRIFSALCNLFCIVLCVIMALYYTNRNYMPIKRVISKLGYEIIEGDEFDLIEECVSKIVNQENLAKDELDNLQRSYKRILFSSLISVRDRQRTKDIMREYNIEFLYGNFILVSFKVDSMGVFEDLGGNYTFEKKTKLCRFVLENVFSEIIEDFCEYEFCTIDNKFICIINFEQKDIIPKLKEKTKWLSVFVDENFGLKIKCFISDASLAENIGVIYSHIDALEKSSNSADGAVYVYDDLPEENIIDDKIQKIIKFIEKNYSDYELNVSYIADEFNMTGSALSRYFKSNMNIGISDYILQYRCKKAVEFLKEDKYSITQVSGKCGFYSAGSFIRAFKRVYGVTPGKYNKSDE